MIHYLLTIVFLIFTIFSPNLLFENNKYSWASVAHACEPPSYSRGRDQEDLDSKSALANSS
jgi:hypothetical protein